MSNLVAVSLLTSMGILAGLVVWCGVSAALLRRWGHFRLDSVVGPLRVMAGESPWILLAILLVSLSTGALAAQVVVDTWDVSKTHQPFVVTIAMSMVGAAMALAGVRLFKQGGLRSIGLEWRTLWPALTQAAGGFLLVLPVVYLVAMIAQVIAEALGRPPEPHGLLEAIGTSANPVATMVLVSAAVIVAPIYEELMFRGLLQTMLMRLLTGPRDPELPVGSRVQGRWQAILITSLLFSAAHRELAFIPPLFVLSAGLGYAYERTGRLWVPMGMHALFNATQIGWFVVLLNQAG